MIGIAFLPFSGAIVRHQRVSGQGARQHFHPKLDADPLTLPWDETFDIGSDTGTPVDDQDYQVPFAFSGKINKLTFAIAPPVLTADDKKKLQEAYRAAQDAN